MSTASLRAGSGNPIPSSPPRSATTPCLDLPGHGADHRAADVSSLRDHEVCGKLMVPRLGLLAHDVVHKGSDLCHRNSRCSASCRQPSPVPPPSSNLMDSERALILESRRHILDTRGHREEVVCAGLEHEKDAQGRTSLAVTAMPRF